MNIKPQFKFVSDESLGVSAIATFNDKCKLGQTNKSNPVFDFRDKLSKMMVLPMSKWIEIAAVVQISHHSPFPETDTKSYSDLLESNFGAGGCGSGNRRRILRIVSRNASCLGKMRKRINFKSHYNFPTDQEFPFLAAFGFETSRFSQFVDRRQRRCDNCW